VTITTILPPRTRLLLEAPILPTLLRLAAPNIGEAVARITFLTADALFVSWLGSDALAAVSVVFPLLMLLQTATAAGFGAGVSSSIGRALGAGDLPYARSLAGTSIALAVVGWALIAMPLLLGGPALYAAMGLKGAALDMAILYGALVFSGSVFVWLMNIMANVSRGAGTMVVPASAIMIGEAFHVALSPALIMGWGPFPKLGIAGAAIAVLSAYVVGTAVLAAYLCSRRALVRLEPALIRLKRVESGAILRVGAVAAAIALQFQATTFFVTGLVGSMGSMAIAAYGTATRLDLVQYPITFAFGSAVITMVATASGAGHNGRAMRIAWTGVCATALIGLAFTAVALDGERWMAIFTTDPAIRDLGALYLLCQAPIYPLIGAGLAGYFACQGVGYVAWPFAIGMIRLAIAVLGGWLALALGGGALALFVVGAAAFTFFSVALLAATYRRFNGRLNAKPAAASLR
jgi:Na+-driven multidrug efflux pump